MAGRQSAAVEKAVREWSRTLGSVYRIATRHGIAASSLYRSIKSKGKKRNGGTK